MSKVLTDQIEKRTGGTAMDVPAAGKWPTANIADAAITTAKMAVDPTNASNLTSGSVPAAALGNVDLTGLQDDIALLGFKTQANGSLAKYSLVDQTLDAFEDATGVDAGASTGLYRSSVGKYYSGATGPDVTGGTITIDGNYTVHTFLANGNYITDTAQTLDYLIVAGGGGGGGDNAGGVDSAGGGGAGGYRSFTGIALPAGTFAAVVGDGGNGKIGHGDGDKGSQSSFNSQTSEGGGYGAGSNNCGGTGGSGGAAGGRQTCVAAGNTPSTSPAQGFPGGHGTGGGDAGGGGGGGGAIGGNSDGTNGGTGGIGGQNSISGTATYYAGGGGGGSYGSANSGPGGAGGGGAGGDGAPGTIGTPNTGGGGGGAGGGTYNGAKGGSGIVIIRRPSALVYVNMTLVSTATTAQAAPTKGDLVFTYSNGVGTAVVGTNITAEYSEDNGSTWTDFTIAPGDVQGTTGGHTIVAKHDVALTSTSGTNMRWRIKTLVQSAALSTRIHAVSLGWS